MVVAATVVLVVVVVVMVLIMVVVVVLVVRLTCSWGAWHAEWRWRHAAYDHPVASASCCSFPNVQVRLDDGRTREAEGRGRAKATRAA